MSIFISYRRDDADGQAGRLFEALTRYFGSKQVFLDVAGIAKGVDFRVEIDRMLANSTVLLVVIGKSWTTVKNAEGQRRIEHPNDFVRLEVAAAIRRSIAIVPVLVQGASMPEESSLPDEIKSLAYRNGIEVTHSKWDSDLQLLIEAIEPLVPGKRGILTVKWAIGAFVAVALVVAWFYSQSLVPREADLKAASPVVAPLGANTQHAGAMAQKSKPVNDVEYIAQPYTTEGDGRQSKTLSCPAGKVIVPGTPKCMNTGGIATLQSNQIGDNTYHCQWPYLAVGIGIWVEMACRSPQ